MTADSGHRRWRRYSVSRAFISPGGRGDGPDGCLWRACPDTVSHTAFPLIVPAWPPLRTGGHSYNPDVLGWPALLDCRIRLTAFLPPHRTDVAGRSECPTTEAWHHRPHRHCPKFRRRRRSSAYRHHRPWVSIPPIGTIAPIDDNRSIIDSIDSE